MRKKFLFALAFLLALSFCASAFGATTLVVKTGGTLTLDNFEQSEETETEEDENGEEVEVVTKVTYTLSKGTYEFSSVFDALDFVSRKEDYIKGKNFTPSSTAPEVEYSLGDVDLTDVEIKLENAILGDTEGITIDSDTYGDLKKILINGNKKTISDSTVTGRYFTLNGGIEFEVKDLTLDGNNSTGGIEIQSGFTSTATFNNVTFQELKADNGGAIYVAGGTLKFSGTNTFTENTATNGGAIYISGLDGITFSDSSKFTTNSADLGGALYFANSLGTTTIDVNSNVTFTSNKATDGGTIYISGGTINIHSDISGEASNNGGAVYVSSRGTANIYGTLEGNKAINGGAIYVSGVILTASEL